MAYQTFYTVLLRKYDGKGGEEVRGAFGMAKEFLSGVCLDEFSGTNKWQLVNKTNREGRKTARALGTRYHPIDL